MTVLAVAEHRRGDVRDVSYQAITAGRQLAEERDEELHVAVISGAVDEFAALLDREGVDRIHTVDVGEEFNHDVYVQVVSELAREVDASTILAGNTVNGLDYAPALADRLDWPLVTDAVALSTEDGDDPDRGTADGAGLTVTRELFGSKLETTLAVHADHRVVTLRPGEWPPAEKGDGATIEPFEVAVDDQAIRTTVTGYEAAGTGDVDITDADVIVAVGRGIGEEENLDIIFELADALDATVAASRPIIDNDWLPPERQVGQSGKVVTPDVYIAIGISGAVQHVAGMKGAETIIAINSDPNAPIFDLADYGVVDDLFEVVPALTAAYS